MSNIKEPKILRVEKSVLRGEVTVSGAKNSVLRLLAASLLTEEDVILHNYPSTLLDAEVHVEMLRSIGKSCAVNAQESEILISEQGSLGVDLNWEGRSIRNTLLILGALLTRYGKASVPAPGGCAIGTSDGRSYDLHISLLEAMGADITIKNGVIHAESKGRLKGTDIWLPIRSTGATENGIIAGSLAEGVTRIWNPHIRPEIIDLVDFLNSMGAKIKVYGQEHIEITGVSRLKGITHRVMPDNVEALTWLVAAAITGGEIEIKEFPFEHLEVPLIFLRESGIKMFRGETGLVVRGSSCYPLEVSTGPYPGINSDMQPIMAVMGMLANGESKFVDLRFPGRYGYALELEKLGATCQVKNNLLVITGKGRGSLQGSSVRALDLRAGIAAALAGFVAEGETEISDAWQICRGYDRFVEKVKALNGNAEWIY